MPESPERTALYRPHDGAIRCATHRMYEMDCAEFEALRTRSADHCEACGIAAEETILGRLIIDHDHRYGNAAVRGLICSSCNSLLGALETGPSASSPAERQRFDTYLRRAWFLQVARWGRLHSPQLAISEDERTLASTILRSSVVRTLTDATGQQPSVDLVSVLTPGPIRHRADVMHSIPEASDFRVEMSLLCSKQRKVDFQSVTCHHDGHPVSFESAAKAAAHVRSVRRSLRQFRTSVAEPQ